jgi:hypothetical protein
VAKKESGAPDVVIDPETVPVEVLASDIKAIADALAKVMNSRLSFHALTLLVWENLPKRGRLNIKRVEEVLIAFMGLSSYIVKPGENAELVKRKVSL